MSTSIYPRYTYCREILSVYHVCNRLISPILRTCSKPINIIRIFVGVLNLIRHLYGTYQHFNYAHAHSVYKEKLLIMLGIIFWYFTVSTSEFFVAFSPPSLSLSLSLFHSTIRQTDSKVIKKDIGHFLIHLSHVLDDN